MAACGASQADKVVETKEADVGDAKESEKPQADDADKGANLTNVTDDKKDQAVGTSEEAKTS